MTALKNYIAVFLTVVVLVSCGSSDSPEPVREIKPIPVNISFSAASDQVPTDAEGIKLTWSVLTATYCEASGDWSGVKDTIGSETLTFSSVGDKSFTLSCRNNTARSEKTVNVYYFNPFEGYLVDGYIEGATCVQSSSFEYDDATSSVISVTDSYGFFKIEDGTNNVVCKDGLDTATSKDLSSLVLYNDLENKDNNSAFNFLVTPVTTLSSNVAFQGNADSDSYVILALGLETGINLNEKDPFSNRELNNNNKFYFEKNAQLTVLALGLTKAFEVNNTNSAFASIAEVLVEQYDSNNKYVNIEDKNFVTKVMKNLNLSDELSESQVKIANMISNMLPLVSVKGDSSITNAVVGFGTDTLLNDISKLLNDNLTDEEYEKYSNANSLTEYIADVEGLEDAEELLPAISAENDSVVMNEDEEGTFNPLLNDDYNVNESYEIVFAEPSSNLSIASGAGGSYTITPATNFNGTETLNYSLIQGDLTDAAEVNVVINAVNDAPTLIKPIISISENSTSKVVVLQDVDNDEIESSLSGDDSSFFEITNKTINPKNSLDYDTPQDKDGDNQYSVVLSFSDGIADTSSEAMTVKLTNLNDNSPVVGTTSFSVAENQTAVGSVSGSDADGDSLTYSVIGDDDTWFSISAAGVLSFAKNPDYEYKETYNIIVSVTDGKFTTDQAVVVTVTNVNDNSPVVGTTAFIVAENQTAIGSVSATDADGDSLTYSLSGTDASSMSISSSGVLSFVTAPDYETKTLYSATVTVSDGTNSTSAAITIAITDDTSDNVTGIQLPENVQIVETQEE